MKYEGNKHYLNKEYDKALTFYHEAIKLNPYDITFYSNCTAVYLQIKDYSKCIKYCDKSIDILEVKEGNSNNNLILTKILKRKVQSLYSLKFFDESIRCCMLLF